jgi:ABC-2 type transport system ATP-binding protein
MNTTTSGRPVHAGPEVPRHVTVRYGSKRAVDDVSFTIPKGRVVGLLGHNGAGKTTLMKAMVGLTAPEGTLQVLGLNPQRSACNAAVGLLHPRRGHPAALGPRAGADHADERPAPALLGRAGARPAGAHQRQAGRQGQDLSKGMVVQAHLALVAAIDARLMILDEPTLGLDVLSRKAFYEMLIDEWCDGERSVLISTHQVEEIENLLSDVLMLNEGKLVLSISLEDDGPALRRAEPRRRGGRADGRRPPAAALPRAGRQRGAVRRRAARRARCRPWASACGPAWWTCSWR